MKSIFIFSFTALLFSMEAYAGAAPANTPELQAKGKTVYDVNCKTCHGPKGDGMGDAGQYMQPKPRNFAIDPFIAKVNAGEKPDSPAVVFNTVAKGLPGTAMVGFPTLSDDDRWAVTYYVLHFRKK